MLVQESAISANWARDSTVLLELVMIVRTIARTAVFQEPAHATMRQIHVKLVTCLTHHPPLIILTIA